VHAPELAQSAVHPRRLEHLLLDRSCSQLLRTSKRIEQIAFLTSALADAGDHDFLDMRRQDLVQPGALRAFLQAQMLPARDATQVTHQRLAVGLHDVVA
jgi:hypothetical protein